MLGVRTYFSACAVVAQPRSAWELSLQTVLDRALALMPLEEPGEGAEARRLVKLALDAVDWERTQGSARAEVFEWLRRIPMAKHHRPEMTAQEVHELERERPELRGVVWKEAVCGDR